MERRWRIHPRWGPRRPRPLSRMRESLKQLGRELEAGIDGRSFFAPTFTDIGANVAVKTGVDLAAIEELGQIFERMELAPLQVGRIDHVLPVFIGKSSC